MHVHWKGCIVGCPDFSIITNFRWSSTVNTTQTNHNMLCTAYTINYLSEVFCSFEQSTTSQLSSKLRGRWLDLYVQAWLRGPWEVTPLPSGNFQILSQSNYFTCTPSAYQQGWQDQRHQNFTRYVRSKKLCQAVPQDQRWRLDTISQNNICPWKLGSVISLFSYAPEHRTDKYNMLTLLSGTICQQMHPTQPAPFIKLPHLFHLVVFVFCFW